MDVSFTKDEPKKKSRFPRFLMFLKNPRSLFYYFLFLCVLGIGFFAVSLFDHNFTTPFTGDYTMQQLPFYTNGYDDWWRFITTGNFTLYDPNTYLGASSVGSNAFYYLTDPFFLPILLFPRSAIWQGIAILTIIKMATAGLMFCLYLRYMGAKDSIARLAGIAYGFCGWITWYLWFNHFTGVAVMFPVILLGVEKVLRQKRPWLLMIALFLMGLCNYFFFFTFLVCAFIYAMFRFFQRLKLNTAKENWKILGIGFIGFFTGCLLASIIVMPATLATLNSPRATDKSYLHTLLDSIKSGNLAKAFGLLFDWRVADSAPYKNYYPIISFVFPVMSDRGTALTQSRYYDNIAGSFFCYSPFIIMFVPAIIDSIRKKKISHWIAIAAFILMLFSPFFYYAFHGFTNGYARWNLFVTTSFMTYVALYMSKMESRPRWTVFCGVGVTIIFVWLSVLFAAKIHMDFGELDRYVRLRYVYDNLGTYGFLIIEGAVATAYVAVVGVTIFFLYNKKYRDSTLKVFVMAEALLMGALTIYGHGVNDMNYVGGGPAKREALATLLEKMNNMEENKNRHFRIYTTQETYANPNDGMLNDYNGTSFFHSAYNYNVQRYAYWNGIIGYSSGYSGNYLEKRHNMDEFLGIKYHFIHKDSYFYGGSQAIQDMYQYYQGNMPLGFTNVTGSKFGNDTYWVYENQNFIDLGFSFDKVATYKDKNDDGSMYLTRRPFINEVCLDELYLTYGIMGETEVEKAKEILGAENVKSMNSIKNQGIIDTKEAPEETYTKRYYDVTGQISDASKNASSIYMSNRLLHGLDTYPSTTTKPTNNSIAGRYVTVIEFNYDDPNPKNNFPYDPKGMAIYLKNSYDRKNAINVYLVTEVAGVEKFVAFDNHMDTSLDTGDSSYKNYRGFYSNPTTLRNGTVIDAPKITKMIICSRNTAIYNYDIFYDTATNYEARIAKIKENQLQDVHYGINHFDFKTNYEKQRLIVTRIPYEKGWSVSAKLADGTTKNLEVFSAQGGFTSFFSEKGEVTYDMNFYTAYLKEASLISAVGELMFASTLIGYVFLDQYRKEKEIQKSLNFAR